MSYTLRTKAELKFKNKDDGEKITYQFDRSLEPFEIAKAMMVLHASNHGIVKLKDDMGNFLTQFIEELKAEKIKRENAQYILGAERTGGCKDDSLKKGGGVKKHYGDLKENVSRDTNKSFFIG